jgi:hypothetical protein
MGVKNISDEYKIIVRFFKEIGLYKEFKEYCHWCITCYVDGYYNFKTWETRPLKNFGSTQITHWLESEKGIKLKGGGFNLYDYFKAWLFTFYPNYYDVSIEPYKDALKTINKEKRTIKIEFLKRKKR